MFRPGLQQRIDGNIQILPKIMPGRHHVSTMEVDEGGTVRLDDLIARDYAGAVFAVSHPKRVAAIDDALNMVFDVAGGDVAETTAPRPF